LGDALAILGTAGFFFPIEGVGGSLTDEAAADGGQVILDTNAVIRFQDAQAFLLPGETPVITDQVVVELNELVSRGAIDGVPNIVEELQLVPDAVDVTTQALVRQQVAAFSGSPTGIIGDINGIQGLTGDGIIGSTGILTGRPIITFDDDFIQALSKLGASVRGF
jgi:hypothetical protein